MIDSIINLFNQYAFLIGLIAGILLFVLLQKYIVALNLFKPIINIFQSLYSTKSKSSVLRKYNSHLYNLVQRQHLLADLFPLEEIVIPPIIFAPWNTQEQSASIFAENIVQETIPDMPDMPELASFYKSPTISLLEALSGGANLILMGDLGSGKTIALCDLVSCLLNNPTKTKDYSNFLPIYLHVSQLDVNLNQKKVVDLIIEAVLNRINLPFSKNLANLITSYFNHQKILLLIDGLDEFHPKYFDTYVQFINTVIENYPKIHIVTTATPNYLGKLTQLGFIPITMGMWNLEKQHQLISRYASARLKLNQQEISSIPVAKELLEEWLIAKYNLSTPLECTLRTYAAYNNAPKDPISNYYINHYLLSRLDNNNNHYLALEKIALYNIIKLKPFARYDEVKDWSIDVDEIFYPSTDKRIINQEIGYENSKLNIYDNKISRNMPFFKEIELLWEPQQGKYLFKHPFINAYLAACALNNIRSHLIPSAGFKLRKLDSWGTKIKTLELYLSENDDIRLINQIIELNSLPLNTHLLYLGKFLQKSNTSLSWRQVVLKKLITNLVAEETEKVLATKIFTTILLSCDHGIESFLKDLSSSTNNTFKVLGALGIGYLGLTTYIDKLIHFMDRPLPLLQRAAGLALASINNAKSIETLAKLLLHGNETQKRVAAEALAVLPSDGFKILEEASQFDDVSVRRAAIFGLVRIRNGKSLEIINYMQQNDTQWAVKDLAMNVIDTVENNNFLVPRPNPSPADSTWLIKFAAERGEGLSTSKQAMKMVLTALREGEIEYKLLALEYLKYFGDSSIEPWILELYETRHEYLKTIAYKTLWFISQQNSSS